MELYWFLSSVAGDNQCHSNLTGGGGGHLSNRSAWVNVFKVEVHCQLLLSLFMFSTDYLHTALPRHSAPLLSLLEFISDASGLLCVVVVFLLSSLPFLLVAGITHFLLTQNTWMKDEETGCHWTLERTCQTNTTVMFRKVSMCSEKPTGTPLSLSEVFPAVCIHYCLWNSNGPPTVTC